ncbi:hypothetical protein [Brevibacillus laterosporus]|uniref:Uncharacterized protein n=1 Tax=Brevibacillus laterosporus TaxID=1465 RepID=A0AAP3G8P4_BRELA|nr:hypothetical protein [Brevibacillus laterosporus]MCR8981618.1 hypothetical protein [Brevibacillus laterosporus]MCZ0808773.1 hypothetical protein [Brevibacillus laterosporus]MCZ0827254.1 hypothetical protein [Brevibacillus laterosporus]MCZ0851010.1 hypothetical protein [Brevibacillus laterosporus]
MEWPKVEIVESESKRALGLLTGLEKAIDQGAYHFIENIIMMPNEDVYLLAHYLDIHLKLINMEIKGRERLGKHQ